MIHLIKPDNPPPILKLNEKKWTENLIQAITNYGSYNKIPSKEKEKLLGFYRHPEIKEHLFKISNDKCAFCEGKPGESGNIEVEHYAPKSIYYKKTFEWSNFLPVCRKCNEAKSDLDTIQEPIINPCVIDPEDYIAFDGIFIIQNEFCPNERITLRTIKELKLNSRRLFKARAELLANLSSYIVDLENWLEDLEEVSTSRKRHNRILKLRDSLENIEVLTESNEKYSAFSKLFLRNNKTYNLAKKIVEEELAVK